MSRLLNFHKARFWKLSNCRHHIRYLISAGYVPEVKKSTSLIDSYHKIFILSITGSLTFILLSCHHLRWHLRDLAFSQWLLEREMIRLLKFFVSLANLFSKSLQGANKSQIDSFLLARLLSLQNLKHAKTLQLFATMVLSSLKQCLSFQTGLFAFSRLTCTWKML